MLRVNHLIGFGVGAVGGGGPPPVTGWYALARKNTDQTNPGGTGDVPMTLEVDVSDTPGIHDTSSDTSRFTVPAAWNGRYGRITYNLRHTSGGEAMIASYTTRDGSAYQGRARPDTGSGSGHQNDYANGKGAIVQFSTGQYFEVKIDDNCTIGDVDDTWAQLELMPSDFSGCVVYKSGTQALSAATTTDLTWATELYDVGGWFDSGTSTTELTVPTGVSLVRLSAGIYIESVADQLVGSMQLNGAAAYGLPARDCDTDGIDSVNLFSAPIAVSAGDDFKCRAFSTNAVNVAADTATWFGIEELPSDLKYALVNRSSNQSISLDTWTTISWNQEQVDTDAFHDNSTNPSRLTIPVGSGITHARVCFNLNPSSGAGELLARVLKNGSSFSGMAFEGTDTAGTDNLNGATAIIEVSEGDYFEIEVWTGNVGGVTIGSGQANWASIEEVRDAS